MQMAALDDQALALALAQAALPGEEARRRAAAERPAYATLHAPTPWPSAAATAAATAAAADGNAAFNRGLSVRGRAFGAVLGSIVADAAAMGVHCEMRRLSHLLPLIQQSACLRRGPLAPRERLLCSVLCLPVLAPCCLRTLVLPWEL